MDGKRSKWGQKHPYRHRVSCSECSKNIDSDYKDRHAKSKHPGKNLKFTTIVSPSQTQLNFTRKNDNEPVGVAKRPKLDQVPVDSVKSVINLSESVQDTLEQDRLLDTLNNDDNTDNTATISISQLNTNSVSGAAFQFEEISLSNLELSETRKSYTSADSSQSPEINRVIESSKINSYQTEKESYNPNGNVSVTLNSDLDGPRQPVLEQYHPTTFDNESFQRDFQAGWYK